MKILSSKKNLSGHIQVPGSKSHTIRALLLSAMASGVSKISNPLPSADCLSAGNALPLLGAQIDFGNENDNVWTVSGAGEKLHLPSDVVNVGNSGSLLYFLSPIAATFSGWSVFTGDSSIRKRPVNHVVDALKQLGAEAYITRPECNAPPVVIQGPINTKNKVVTDGTLSQYISGLMMAASLMDGTLTIELTDPKETPYLTMTKLWLESYGVQVEISSDFKLIKVFGPAKLSASNRTIPSDWEGVAFPLIAALITDSEIVIDNVDGSGSQGDDEIVNILKSVGADIEWNKTECTLTVRGGKKSRLPNCGKLKAPKDGLHIKMSGFPDAICALSVIACFIEGDVFLEDADVCRRKETDRLKVLNEELSALGAKIEEGKDFLLIHGQSKFLDDGAENKLFSLHGGNANSYDDHRIAMCLACLGLGLNDGEKIIVNDAECCAVSFPHFFDAMNNLGADFTEV